MFDREAAVKAFRAYTAGYDPENAMIRLKIEHTFRVAGLCGKIAGSLGMTGAPLDLAWFLGLLHDIGRFEQVRRYGTFFDAKSVDHAEFGADLLFREGLIGRFPAEGLPEGWPELSETAIRLHNKLTLPKDLDPQTRIFAEILRDADKVDIFRVVAEIPLEERLGKSAAELTAEEDLTPEVMACVYGHRCVPREVRRTRFDNHISHGCMAFELVFDESRRIAAEQGFLDRLLAEKDENGRQIWNGKETEALRILRQEIRRAFTAPKLILITNDDGINAGGMRRLAEQAVKHGEVWIVAPDSQRSAASHCITLHRHVDVFPVEYPVEGVKAFSCTGSPADCVRVGCLYLLPRKPDVVLSGVNHGWNVATDIQYSATAGAAMEAAFQEIPAIAFSEEAVEIHEATDRYLPQILGELLESETLKTLPPTRILNVNFPGCPIGECRGIMRDVTVSGGRVFRDHYVLQKTLRDGGMRLEVEGVPDKRAEEGTDLWAVTHGYVSVGIARNIS